MILTPMVIADAPTCNTPNTQAAVVNAVTPDYPDSAKDLGLGRIVILVAVTLDGNGNVVEAHIQQSSYNMALDQAALRAARFSTYSPMVVNCQATTGALIFRAVMDPANAPNNQRYVSCATPNRPPIVTSSAAAVAPPSAASLPAAVTVRVLVTVARDGSVQAARIVQSSNDTAIDGAALDAARRSQYAPQILACVPVLGTIFVRETFGPR